MTQRCSLNLKLVVSVLAAFLLSMAFTWFLHSRLSERDAYKLIDATFENVASEMTDCVDERLVLQCMAVRERIEDDGYPTDVPSLQALAREMNVTEISLAATNGDIVASSDPGYLAAPGRPAFNFNTAGGKAEDMMCLVAGPETEYCQPYRSNTANGAWRKFVGVWMPSTGGFVEIGCDGESLRGLARSSLMDLFRNWRVGGAGGIVVTTTSGLILSDYTEPNREGSHWEEPDETFYWKCKEIEGVIVLYNKRFTGPLSTHPIGRCIEHGFLDLVLHNINPLEHCLCLKSFIYEVPEPLRQWPFTCAHCIEILDVAPFILLMY